ncbi:L-gulonolactone oxidase [Frankineae bacterium MT45]|nr:L-gulonolactone oxidase [Frankineae bacterium MT45]
MSSVRSWQNWAGNQRAEVVNLVSVESADQLSEAVARGAAAGTRLRPIGSGHSFTGIGRPEQVQLKMDAYAGIVDLQRDTGLVKVRAGTSLHQLNRDLAAEGMALTNLGDIDVQTVAGAVSTGTHGTGLRFGGIATQIRGLDLVQPDGSTLTCSATENADVFTHARVGLGALGVISTVTLQAEPLFALRAVEGPMRLGDVFEQLDELVEGTDHFEFYWFPHTDRTLTKRNTRLPVTDGLHPLTGRRRWWDDEFMANNVFGAIIATGRRLPATVRTFNGIASRALGAREFTDLSYRVFASVRRVRFVEMEYAVPREALEQVLTELDVTIERSGWRIAFPVEVRVAAADDIPLSTAYQRESAYIAIHLPVGVEYDQYFQAMEAIAAAVGGRPHWGKMHYLDAAALRTRYPRFDEFVALRNRLDPTGIFSNRYLERVLGPLPG